MCLRDTTTIAKAPRRQYWTLRAGQTLLIRGGTSALGYVTAALARDLGATVLATTRRRDRLDTLAAHGVHHPILDDLPAPVLQRYLDQLAEGTLSPGPTHVYQLSDLREAHRAMADNTVSGKLVVLTGPHDA